MTIQFSNNPGISVRICVDLYRFAGSAQHGHPSTRPTTKTWPPSINKAPENHAKTYDVGKIDESRDEESLKMSRKKWINLQNLT